MISQTVLLNMIRLRNQENPDFYRPVQNSIFERIWRKMSNRYWPNRFFRTEQGIGDQITDQMFTEMYNQ